MRGERLLLRSGMILRKETGETYIYPKQPRTDQLIGFRARHFIIPRWLDQCLPDSFS